MAAREGDAADWGVRVVGELGFGAGQWAPVWLVSFGSFGSFGVVPVFLTINWLLRAAMRARRLGRLHHIVQWLGRRSYGL